MLQPERMKSAVSQSSNAGCVGGSLRVPKSDGEFTSGSPKCSIQTRFTNTRAVSGFVGDAMAWASSKRPLPRVKGFDSPPLNTCTNARGTASPNREGFPRLKMRGSYGSGRSATTIACAGGGLVALTATLSRLATRPCHLSFSTRDIFSGVSRRANQTGRSGLVHPDASGSW